MKELIKNTNVPSWALFNNPFDLLFKNRFDTDSLFDSIFDVKPHYPIDIYETDANITIDIAAVGVSRDDVNIEVENNHVLTVSYQNDCGDTPDEPSGKYYIKRGIVKKSFSFSWKFSNSYNVEDAEVTLKDGLLRLVVPKVEPQKNKKQITIN